MKTFVLIMLLANGDVQSDKMFPPVQNCLDWGAWRVSVRVKYPKDVQYIAYWCEEEK